MSSLRHGLFLFIFLGTSCQTRPAGQVGVVAAKSGKICLEIRNSKIPVNTQIRILNVSPPQTTTTARVESKDESCAGDNTAENPLYGYVVKLDGGPDTLQMPSVGILNFKGEFHKDGDWLSADLDREGQPQYFRACASSEGIHFTLWTGKPLSGSLRWHQYYFLGYDTSANCTAEELGSAK